MNYTNSEINEFQQKDLPLKIVLQKYETNNQQIIKNADNNLVINKSQIFMTKKLPTINIKGKEYILVKDRIIEFNSSYANGKITTEIIKNDETSVIVKAIITPDIKNPERNFTGHSEAYRKGQMGDVPVEIAETSAVGRALAMLGIGIVDSIASADEVLNATRGQNSPSKAVQSEKPMFGSPTCSNCGNPMTASKFKEGEFYCKNYKNEKAKGMPIYEDIPIIETDKQPF